MALSRFRLIYAIVASFSAVVMSLRPQCSIMFKLLVVACSLPLRFVAIKPRSKVISHKYEQC